MFGFFLYKAMTNAFRHKAGNGGTQRRGRRPSPTLSNMTRANGRLQLMGELTQLSRSEFVLAILVGRADAAFSQTTDR